MGAGDKGGAQQQHNENRHGFVHGSPPNPLKILLINFSTVLDAVTREKFTVKNPLELNKPMPYTAVNLDFSERGA
jgi:hypothetical protein